MLTKHKDVRPQKDVKGLLKNVFMSAAYSEFFSVRGHRIFTYFQAHFFPEELLGSILRIKKAVEGSGGVLSQKTLKNLQTVVAILVLFEQSLRKLCLNLLPLNLSVSPNIMQFFSYIFDYACSGREAYCY